MERKKFLLTTAAAIPALLIGQNIHAQKLKRPKKGFVVKAAQSRFDEKTVLGGKTLTISKFLKRIQTET
ncbi:MAG: hypothetical protein ABI359_12965 [Ginsengibacter sp.]